MTPGHWVAASGALALLAVAAATVGAQTQTFSDVPPDHDHHEAVEWAAAAGVTTGWGDGTFRPDQPLTEAQAVAFMERFYSVVVGDGPAKVTRGDMMALLHAMSEGRPPALPPPTLTAGGPSTTTAVALEAVGKEWRYQQGTDPKTDEWWYRAWVEEHSGARAAAFGLACWEDGTLVVWVADPDAFVFDDDYSTEGVTAEYRIDSRRLVRQNWWRGDDYKSVGTWGDDGPALAEALAGSERFRVWAGDDRYSNSLQAEFRYSGFGAVAQACRSNTALP